MTKDVVQRLRVWGDDATMILKDRGGPLVRFEDYERLRTALERIVRMPMKHEYREGCLCMGCVPKTAAIEALGSPDETTAEP